MPALSLLEWLLVLAAAFCAGLSKAGFSGLGLVGVVVFANIFGARESTGVFLPLLIAADVGAVGIFRQHARWDHLKKTLPPAGVGVVIGALVIARIDNDAFRPLLGWIILGLTVMQLARVRWPEIYGDVPHSAPVGWSLGLLAGVTTMVANAAGPLIALYCVAIGLPKYEIVGTLAWFFFIINLFKAPFSVGLGLIHGSSILFDLLLVPVVILGLLAGRWLIGRIPQRTFDATMLAFAAAAALRLIV